MARSGAFQIFLDKVKNGGLYDLEKCYREEYLNQSDGTKQPIHHAAFYNNVDSLKFLLDRKCDIEAVGEFGYRAIHYSTANGNVNVLRVLLDHNCDMEAADNDGWRAIHHATNSLQIGSLQILMDRKCDIEAQTKRRLTALHQAASNGHVHSAQLLLNHNCNREATDNRQWRAVHYAASGGHVNMLKLLLENNCNIEAENNKGLRAIHLAASAGHVTALQCLIESKCEMEANDHIGRKPLHHAASQGHVDVIQILFDYNCDMEAADNDGLRAIHCAASDDQLLALTALLNHNCDIEAQSNDGKRALHFAVSYGYMEIVQSLIDYNCEITPKTKNMHTPLNLASERLKDRFSSLFKRSLAERKETIQIDKVLTKSNVASVMKILAQYPLSKIMNQQTKTTILDALVTRMDSALLNALGTMPVTVKEIDDFIDMRDKPINVSSYRMLQECLLYRCIRQEYGYGFESTCTAIVVNRDSLFLGPSVLETVTEYGRVMYVSLVLSQLLVVDKLWTWAIDVGTTRKNEKIVTMISRRQQYLELQYKDGYNRLHIAVFDKDPEMVAFILDNELVDPDEGSETVGSAISHAYRTKCIECISQFTERGVNVNMVNHRKESPLDVAIMNGMGDYCDYLVDNTENINARDHMGLTMLEKAVIGECEKLCVLLLNKGALCQERIQIYPEWLNIDPEMNMIRRRPCLRLVTTDDSIISLCLKTNGVLYPCLLEQLDLRRINRRESAGNTVLHLASSLLLSDVCVQLLSRGAHIDPTNEDGYTPLMNMLQDHRCYQGLQTNEEDLIKTANVLLDRGASINIEDRGGHNLLERATSCGSERLLLTLIRRGEPIECLKEPQLVAWLQQSYFLLLTQCLDRLEVTLLKKWLTFDVINHVLTVSDLSLTVSLLGRAEESVSSSIMERVLYKAAKIGDEATFNRLINSNIVDHSSLDAGESLMHCLIREKNIKFCQFVLRSRNASLLVEKKNSQGQLPLHICIEGDVQELMDNLIIETKGVNDEDSKGHTPLSLLLEKVSAINEESILSRTMMHVKMLINRSSDIYKVNKFNKMIIDFCRHNARRQEIEEFSNREKPPIPAIPAIPSIPAIPAIPENDEMICRICRDNRVDCVFECGHVICMTCGLQVCLCPMCRYAPTNPRKMLI